MIHNNANAALHCLARAIGRCPKSTDRCNNAIMLLTVMLIGVATFQVRADDIAVNPALAAPPIEILYGAYEIVGKSPGAAGDNYRAWVRIAVEGQTLVLDRCFDGKRSEGRGELVTVGADQMPAVRFEFSHHEQAFEATCIYHSDFDNLPRFSCYTYPLSQRDIKVPGLEAYFPIVWPVALDYFDCQ